MMFIKYPSIRGEDLTYYANNSTSKLLYYYIYAHGRRLIYVYLGDGLKAITIL